ncbi:MAG: DUF4190 domain-containing protein [Actinomycetota bacterium]|nr:DUF4190 domain-containing protein [Actinomycetota bacterium]
MSEPTQPSERAADGVPAPDQSAPDQSASDLPVTSEPAPAAPAQWPAAEPAATSAYPAAPSAYPTAYPPAPAYASGPRTSSNAIVALVLAITSWAICPIAAAIVALVFASMATKELDASDGALEGRGLVTAAKIVSWINIGLWAAMIVLGAFGLVLWAIVAGASR